MLLIGLPSNQQWHTSCKYTSPANGNGRTSFGNFEVELEDMLGRHVGNQVEDQELCIMMMMRRRRRRTTMTIVDIKHSTYTSFSYQKQTACQKNPKKNTNVFAMSFKTPSLSKKNEEFSSSSRTQRCHACAVGVATSSKACSQSSPVKFAVKVKGNGTVNQR